MSDGRSLAVFIDEAGAPHQNPPYVCVAIIVDADLVGTARATLDAVAQQHFSGGEMKSSNIRGNWRRRRLVLEALEEIDFQYSCLLVDTRSIDENSGLSYRDSFNKYFKRMLQAKALSPDIESVSVRFDNYGYEETMSRFESYMENRLPRSLLFSYECEHVDSLSDRLVQLADLVAGTLRRYYMNPSHQNSDMETCRKILLGKQRSLDTWPPLWTYRRNIVADEFFTEEHTRAALARASSVRDRYRLSGGDQDAACGVILDELSSARLYEATGMQSVYAEGLISTLQAGGFDVPSKRELRRLVGCIRDDGVVIAGSSSGYKLAITPQDVQDYLEFTQGIVLPMIKRVGIAEQSVKDVTQGKLTLETLGFPVLARVTEIACDAEAIDYSES